MVYYFIEWCSAACSQGRKVINVHAAADAKFVSNSLHIFKYSQKLMVVMTDCENDSRWLKCNVSKFACTLCYCKLEKEVDAELRVIYVPDPRNTLKKLVI